MKKYLPKKISMKSEAGFTLIEALVAIMIMALGLIGLALMQAQGLKFTTGAYSRTQASMLANDIIDRMRVHGDEIMRQDSLDGDPADYIGAYVDAATTIEAGSNQCADAGDAIDPENLVAHNVACWKDLVDEQINGTATIDFSEGSPTLLNITINWTERAIASCTDCPTGPVDRSLSIVTEVNPIEF